MIIYRIVEREKKREAVERLERLKEAIARENIESALSANNLIPYYENFASKINLYTEIFEYIYDEKNKGYADGIKKTIIRLIKNYNNPAVCNKIIKNFEKSRASLFRDYRKIKERYVEVGARQE